MTHSVIPIARMLMTLYLTSWLIISLMPEDADAVVGYRHRSRTLGPTPPPTPSPAAETGRHRGSGRRRVQLTRSRDDDDDFSTTSRGRHRVGDIDISFSWQRPDIFSNQRDAWWNGENVCSRTVQSIDVDDDVTRRSSSRIQHHYFAMSSICDDDDDVYKCTVIRSYNGNTTRITKIYECCHGYRRVADERGCSHRDALDDVITTLQQLNATEMIQAIEAANLQSSLATENVTVFAPTNDAFDALHPAIATMGDGNSNANNNNNVMIITPQLVSMAHDLQQTISGHLVPGFIRSADFEDDLILDTQNPQAPIRINVFNLHTKTVTVNCLPVTSVDHAATNGVIHLVSGVIQPVTSSIVETIRNMPHLSRFLDVLQRSGLSERLSEMGGDVTVFASSNDAFNKLEESVRQQLLGHHSNVCLTNMVLHHVVRHVICSASIDSEAYTVNALGHRVNLTRLPLHQGLRYNTAAVTSTDIMTTDGVLHVIDEVLVPNDALNLEKVAEKLGATHWQRLIHKSKMADSLNSMRNFTVFLPNNDAFKSLSSNVTELWNSDSSELTRLLQRHVVPDIMVHSSSFYNNLHLQTLDSDQLIAFNVLHSYPFSAEQESTVQCAPIISTDVATCSGIIHQISEVMLPPVGDILDVLYHNAEFSELVSLMKAVNFAEAFQSDEIVTFFAPTNQAFSSIPPEVLREITENHNTAQQVLQHHIMRGVICCSTMAGSRWFTAQQEETIDGHWVSLHRRRGQSTVDSVPIQTCDRPATNGLVHAVDSFLPSSIRHHVAATGRRHRHRQDSDIWSVLDRLHASLWN